MQQLYRRTHMPKFDIIITFFIITRMRAASVHEVMQIRVLALMLC